MAAKLAFNASSDSCVVKSVRYEFVELESARSDATLVLIGSSSVDIFNARSINLNVACIAFKDGPLGLST